MMHRNLGGAEVSMLLSYNFEAKLHDEHNINPTSVA